MKVADHFNQLDEDRRRLVVRGDIKQWNQLLVEMAHDAGVISNEEFAIFQNVGYMGSTELIAILFRISQTEEKLRKDRVEGAENATSIHYNVNVPVSTWPI